MSKRFFLLVFLAMMTLSGFAHAQDTRIVAVVNDDVVTTDDLNNRILLVMKSSGIPDTAENRQRLNSRVLRSLIDEKLQLQEAKHVTVAVTKEELDQALGRIEQQNNMPKGQLDKFLEQAGIPRSSLVDQITASIAWGKLVQNRLSMEVVISDEEVSEAMKRIKQNENTPQSEVSEIFLAVDNPTQDEEVQRLAERLEQQLHGGANFASVAQQFSQSPTAAVGGDLGWITPSEISPALGDALQTMKAGDISAPIHTGGGYYILLLNDRRMPGQASPDDTEVSISEAGAPIPADAPPDYRTRLNAVMQQLQAAGQSCATFAAAAKKFGLPFVRDIPPNTRAGTLPVAVRRVILALTPGQVSKPFPVEGGLGIAMLCERKEAKPPAPPTREQVMDNLGRERLDVLARRYLRDLRRTAFVDIRG